MSKSTMKAVICEKYGAPEVLKLSRIDLPTAGENEIRIKIKATAVNSGDIRVRGLAVEGFLKIVMRFVLGFNKPRNPILGIVYAGIVDQVGKNVTQFQVNDEVFGLTGFKFGAYAEYMTISAKSMVAKKPKNATFEEAAALVFGAHTAISFLTKAKIESNPNPNVLIYGATGAVGTSAVQIAKHFNARVVAVCGEHGVSLTEKLGADRILVYTQDDFTRLNEKFDIIFDAVGKISKKQCKSLLKENGIFKTVGGLEVASEQISQLELVRTLFEHGKYNPTIDKTFAMEQIVEAHRYVDSGRKKGNVVIQIQ